MAKASGGFDVLSTGHTYLKEGSYAFSVTIADHGGSSTTTTGSATIADAALHASVVSISGTEGAATGSITVARFLDDDPTGTAANYTANIDWGDGSAVEAGSIVAKPGGVFEVTSAGHTYAEEGDYTLAVTISDQGGAGVRAVGDASIADAALHVSAAPIAGTENVLTGNGKVASFRDDDPSASIGDYVATIDWGDGSQVETGSIVANASGGYDISSKGHVYAGAGNYTVQVLVSDRGGAAANDFVTAQIADAPLHVTAFAVSGTEGAPTGGLTVASFTDEDPGRAAVNYSAVIFWGDGTFSNATSITLNVRVASM